MYIIIHSHHVSQPSSLQQHYYNSYPCSRDNFAVKRQMLDTKSKSSGDTVRGVSAMKKQHK